MKHDHSKFRKDAEWLFCAACTMDCHERMPRRSWERATVDTYIRSRMDRAGAFRIDLDVARLCYSPLDQPREPTRELCRLSAKTLASRAAKFLTLADEYAKRRQFERDMLRPPYHLRSLPVTRQSKPEPFESGRNCLPGMESFLRQLAA